MRDISEIRNMVLSVSAVFLTVMIFLCIVRMILGPRHADRITAMNAMWVRISVLLCMLPMFMDGEFIDGICVAFAAAGFVTVTAISSLSSDKERVEL